MPKTDPRIDAYIAKSAEFAKPILEKLRATVHEACPGCEETLKWSMPHFLYEGKILAGMAAFKAHATFGLWNGTEVMGRERSGEAMGHLGRITSVKELPAKKVMVGWIREAMAQRDSGVKPTPKVKKAPKPAVEVPDDLVAALRKNAAARKTFEAFSPSHRREYVEWITEAKREETRAKRLAQTIEWLAEGKHRNWKYENC